MNTEIIRITSISLPGACPNTDDMIYYVCGLPPMMEQVLKQLSEMGVDGRSVITEI